MMFHSVWYDNIIGLEGKGPMLEASYILLDYLARIFPNEPRVKIVTCRIVCFVDTCTVACMYCFALIIYRQE